MSKKITFALAAALFSVLTFTPSAFAQSPVGVWLITDMDSGEAKSHVEIYEKGGKLHGKIVKLLDKPADAKCDKCSGKRKGQPILGMTILWGFEKDDDEWDNGTIFSVDKDMTVSAKLWLEGKYTLKVRGYKGFIYRTLTWKRVK